MRLDKTLQENGRNITKTAVHGSIIMSISTNEYTGKWKFHFNRIKFHNKTCFCRYQSTRAGIFWMHCNPFSSPPHNNTTVTINIKVYCNTSYPSK